MGWGSSWGRSWGRGLLTTHYSLLAAYYVLLTTRLSKAGKEKPLRTTYWLLTIYDLLGTPYSSLLTTY